MQTGQYEPKKGNRVTDQFLWSVTIAATFFSQKSDWYRSFGKSIVTAIMLCLAINLLYSTPALAQDSTKHWVGTWAAAPYTPGTENQPPMTLTNNTLRQIVFASIGSDTLRVKFSNSTFGKAITLNKVNIAVSSNASKSAIDASTIADLKFNGKANVTINANAELFSDPVAFDCKPNMKLAITIYYGQCASDPNMTFHYGSRTDSYIVAGDKTASADFTGASVKESWYTISAVDVLAPKSAAAVAIFGNSITDGYGVHGGPPNRWPDFFSQKLLANNATKEVGVLNLGIGATLVTAKSNGADAGVDRFKHDILDQAGVRWIIIFYGVNDIAANISATNVINGFKKMVSDANAKDTAIKIYGATITPFNGHSYYSASHEQARKDVNNWIRTDPSFDGVLDFDNVLRNPSDQAKLQQQYSNDWLHPNGAGYKFLGESIDLDLFTPPPVKVEGAVCKGSTGFMAQPQYSSGTISFALPTLAFVSLKVFSPLGREIVELAGKTFPAGRHAINLKTLHFAKGMYIYSFKSGNRSASQVMLY